ncbi:MAG: undecaprenyldiphospho-muramoylpentapeptide beta-N-acetylglucosaminyltransferase [Alphaproteobacteria bacterium]|nr:undecaprenyldiphospho-muramoylpentapeptide beta-N-acetylglucosaminyltransferase [Alphaproteobacteria bacterium]
MNSTSRPVLISAGGTGGHMFPAVSLANVLRARGYNVLFATDPRGAALAGDVLGLADGVVRHTISARSLSGGIKGFVAGVSALARGFFESRRLIREHNPCVAVGFGGYPTVPPILASGMAGLPTVIHEQNALLGRANRRLARGASAFALSFAQTQRLKSAGRTLSSVVGNPVRADIAALAARPYTPPSGVIDLLIIGGSQGAQVFSKIVPAAFKSLSAPQRARFRIAQQCRAEDIEAVRKAYAEMNMPVETQTFFEDIPTRLAAAHLVVGRSGASTVAELTAAGRPALYIPYPHAADDHQMANARAVEAAGAGWVMSQSEFTPAAMAGWLEAALESSEALARVASSAHALGHPDAADRLADLVEHIIPANGNGNGADLPELREAAE